jgi:hypothetical protein
MLREEVRRAIGHVGRALRDPEEFALRWHRGTERYNIFVWGALAATAVAGTLAYGMTMGILRGPWAIATSALELTVAAGLAWAIPFPAIYILNSLSGSRLAATTTLLAAAVTTSWGGLALIASIPINWFFSVAIPLPWFVQIVNVVVFTGVGVAMIDVFGRVLQALEPVRGRALSWCLLLVGAIGVEFFHLFRLFEFVPTQ